MEPQMNADERRWEKRGDEDRKEINMSDDSDNPINKLTKEIIGCAFRVSNTLGVGFLEKVYENALAHELRKSRFGVAQQHAAPVYYDGVLVGDYVADVLVNETVLMEIKAVKALGPIHEAQCMNYLRATGLHICLLINFGRAKVEVRRIVKDL